MDLSIIIINYNTIKYTEECLKSVFSQTKNSSFEVLLVDNNSKNDDFSGILKKYPDIRFFKLDRNIGFAAGNNFAAENALGEYILLLNPDTIILNNGITNLLEFAVKNPYFGIFGGRSFFSDGTLNPTSCWGKLTLWSCFCSGIGLSSLLRRNAVFDPESLGKWQRDSVREVDIVTGCFLMLKKDLWDKLQGFDVDFFMYGEDADLCLRAKKIDRKCVICPDATLIHHGGASEKVREDKMVRLYKAEVRLIRKHWKKISALIGVFFYLVNPLNRMIILYFMKIFFRKYDNSYKTWAAIWKRRKEYTNDYN